MKRCTRALVVLIMNPVVITGAVFLSQNQSISIAEALTPISSPTSGTHPLPIPTLPTPALPAPGVGTWKAVGSKVNGIPVTFLATTDSGKIAQLWLDPTFLEFRLIPGTTVPEKSPVRAIDNNRKSWLPNLAAAFNGGFWLRDLHNGGYFYDGKVVRTLVAGQSALVINKSGQLQVGMWGRDFNMTHNLMVVRENMKLVIDNFKDTSAQLEPRQKNLLVLVDKNRNRSLLGQMANGSLIYEYGRSVNFKAMVQGLLAIHVKRAMLLDMNYDWPAAFYYWHSGSNVLGAPIQPQIYHKPSVYFSRFKKDFIVALLK